MNEINHVTWQTSESALREAELQRLKAQFEEHKKPLASVRDPETFLTYEKDEKGVEWTRPAASNSWRLKNESTISRPQYLSSICYTTMTTRPAASFMTSSSYIGGSYPFTAFQ